MKKILIVFSLIFALGCSSVNVNYNITEQELETSSGNKSGIMVLDNGDMIAFKSSYIFNLFFTLYIRYDIFYIYKTYDILIILYHFFKFKY